PNHQRDRCRYWLESGQRSLKLCHFRLAKCYHCSTNADFPAREVLCLIPAERFFPLSPRLACSRSSASRRLQRYISPSTCPLGRTPDSNCLPKVVSQEKRTIPRPW